MNAFERLIEAVAPKFALNRARARAALSFVRDYEGASKGRRTGGWKAPGSSASAETQKGAAMLRNRARDLVRNNPHAARGVSVIAGNIVGYGIKTTFQTPNKKAMKPLQKAYVEWAESTKCDADGMHNIYGLQELAARTIVESGAVLIRRLWAKGQKIPLKLQILEPDMIDSRKDGDLIGGGRIVQGVEYSASGEKVAYHLFKSHPGDANRIPDTVRVPADEIAHVFRVDRPGQVHGVSWFAPVIVRLRDLDEYEDAQLIRQKIAACFTAFYYDAEAPEGTGRSVVEMPDRLEPGLIQGLPPGKQVTFADPPGVQGYGEYMTVTLRAIAAGLGIPYESLTGDYSQVNFTSGRMGRAEFHGLLDVWQWKMFIPGFCSRVASWFLDAADFAGLQATGATAKHTPPRRVLVDPTREIPAQIKAIRAGLQTLFGGIREMGYEPEEFLQEVADGNEMLDSLNLTLDTDPRKVSGAGQVQPAEGGSSSSQREPEDE